MEFSSMTQRTTATSLRSSFSEFRTLLTTGLTAAALVAATLGAHAQDATPAATQTTAPDSSQSAGATSAAPAPAATEQKNDITLSNQKPVKTRKAKEDKVVESKATKAQDKKVKKDDSLAKMDVKLPDKSLYDKAEDAIKHGRFDVGRLDLQTLLNTYPESQYMMRSKLAIADSWYKEGGTAALTQAEQEYKDFITFFPNAPEAAEAQMRVGDIYFREMDKPDRDYTTTVHAEEEYRLMLQQFPESTLVPQAQQRLREVQEVLAARESNIAVFYAQRQPPNYSAAIARYQTVADSYPLYSHMDDVLIGLADAYEAEAKMTRALKPSPAAPEAYKAQLESAKTRMIKIDEDAAQAALDKVVLEHSAAPHVEDAKDRLTGMGLPVPTPTAEQVAASTTLENSRGQYTLSKRAIGFLLHQADTVPASTTGAPPLEDPAPVSAATVARKTISDFNGAMNPSLNKAPAAQASTTGDTPAPDASAPAPAPAPAANTALSFQDVPSATPGTDNGSSAVTIVPQSSPSVPSSGSNMGIEIVQPGSGSQSPATAPTTPPAFPGAASAAGSPQASDYTGGVKPVGPDNATAMAPIEKPAAAPEVINEAAGTKQPAAQTSVDGKKKPKPAFDKSDESSSKHKKKKGIAKINPF
jgi:outer membrane protein assembly factor BamD